MAPNITGWFFFLQEVQAWQKKRSENFTKASGIDPDADKKKIAGVEKLNQYSCEYELQTICELFPALKPEDALMGDDTFYTKHLLSNAEKASFEKRYLELVRKK